MPQYEAWRAHLADPPRQRVEVPQRVAVDRRDLADEAKEIETSLVSIFALSSSTFGSKKPAGGTKVTYRGILHKCILTEVKWLHGEHSVSYTLYLDEMGRPVIAEQTQVQQFLHTPWVQVVSIGRPTSFDRPGIDMGVAALVKQAFISWQANSTYNPFLQMIYTHPEGRPQKLKARKEKTPKQSSAKEFVRFR